MLHGRHEDQLMISRSSSRDQLLLWLAMVLMWRQSTASSSSSQPTKSATFQALPPVSDDVHFMRDVLWEKPAWSDIVCGRMCMDEAQCSMFTFTPGPWGGPLAERSCRIHGRRQSPQGEQEPAPGARSFNILITDFWIKKACATSSDCTEPMAACYSGQCLCDGDFFFDYYQNACVSTCTRSLGDAYVQYKNMTLQGNFKYEARANGDTTSCESICSDDPDCKGFTHGTQVDKCFFKHVTAQDSPQDWQVWPFRDFHQRTCH